MYRDTPLPVGTLLLQALVAPLHGTIANLKRAKLERVAVGGLSLADGRTDAEEVDVRCSCSLHANGQDRSWS